MILCNLLIVLLCAKAFCKQPWEISKNDFTYLYSAAKDQHQILFIWEVFPQDFIFGLIAPCNFTALKDKIESELLENSNQLAHLRTSKEINDEKTKFYWDDLAIKFLKEKIAKKLNTNVAKNVILFLGDGMSIPTITATRVYLGGEEKQLSFEHFPYTALSKTYCVDHQTADSACSATAYLGGVKANLATIGVTAAVEQLNCSAMNKLENRIDSIATLFQKKNKWTGLVTTTRVTHASPAGVYAHTAHRDWESDSDVLYSHRNPKVCTDIATQLILGETGQNLHVILGGGRKKFIPKSSSDEEGHPGDRSDEINLIKEWIEQKAKMGVKSEYVSTRSQLLKVQNDTEYLLGLFANSHMQYNLERGNTTEPSLQEMTKAAIKLLKKGPNGYFLFVEGGKIDKGHHATTPRKALDETAEFSKAIQKAVEMTNEEDTLIVVTADHSHTMTFSGHAKRGTDVFGYAGVADDSNFYTILSYANGPGYGHGKKNKRRYVPSIDQMKDKDTKWPATAPLHSETHGADDVSIYAKGPWAHLFAGVLEQNIIPHIMATAACVSNDFICDNDVKIT